ncbi:MAG TPA: hypothetical protein VL242_46580, partial [Sorangium sp.]|nr:hypothetical protein [Sorangium sp.]
MVAALSAPGSPRSYGSEREEDDGDRRSAPRRLTRAAHLTSLTAVDLAIAAASARRAVAAAASSAAAARA